LHYFHNLFVFICLIFNYLFVLKGRLFSVNFNNVDLKVNSICDVDVFNNTLRVVLHDSNSNYQYIKLEDKNISMFTLSKPLYYPNFRIFRDQSISFFIKDDQIEFYFFELP